MTPQRRHSLYNKLLPVVVGAFLGAVPAIVVSQIQSRAAVRQIVIERQFAAIKDFSSACTRHVLIARRAVFLNDVRQISSISQTPAIMENLLRQHETLNRDAEEARIILQAQADLANALFSTQVTLSLLPELNSAPPTPGEVKTAVEALRQSLPGMAEQCRSATAKFVAKLEG